MVLSPECRHTGTHRVTAMWVSVLQRVQGPREFREFTVGREPECQSHKATF